MLVACGGSGGNDGNGPPQDYVSYPPLWNDYVIGLGETINLAENVSIEFLEVVEDTRCATGAPSCNPNANARVRLKCITIRGSQVIELNTNPAFPSSALFDYYGAYLRKLEPSPTLDAQGNVVRIPPENYEATVFVTKNAEPPS